MMGYVQLNVQVWATFGTSPYLLAGLQQDQILFEKPSGIFIGPLAWDTCCNAVPMNVSFKELACPRVAGIYDAITLIKPTHINFFSTRFILLEIRRPPPTPSPLPLPPPPHPTPLPPPPSLLPFHHLTFQYKVDIRGYHERRWNR